MTWRTSIARVAITSALLASLSLTALAGSAEAAMTETTRWLRAAGEKLANDYREGAR